MKKIILFGIIVFAITGCMTEKKRLEICQTCPTKIETKDSIWEHIVHDTTRLPPIQGPTMWMENPCKLLCDSLGHLKPFVFTAKKNGITSTIKSQGQNVIVNCDADSIIAYTTKVERERYSKQHDEYTKLVFCDKEHRTSFDGFCRWFFYILGGLLIIKYVLKYFKITLPFP